MSAMRDATETCAGRVVEVVPVQTPSRAYDAHVGVNILDDAGELVRASAGGGVAAVISDSNVAPLYAERVLESLRAAGYETALVTFPAGEEHKRLATLEVMLEELANAGLTREDVVVALGGGVTGDMAGLAAAMYLRGIKVAQIPTSLLAMVDSSVGGKTAVDLAAGKNLAGAFFQPHVVLADVACLHTLSHDLLTDSCGEVVKHGVLCDPELFDNICEVPVNAAGSDDERLARIVARNVAIKRDVVNADEKERGLRQTLNLGHTLGHAIEAASNFELGHGSSVAAGLCCVSRAAERLEWAEPGITRQIEQACRAHGLPTDTEFDHETIFEYATRDKKRRGSTITLVVPVRIGKVTLRKVTLRELREVIELGCGTEER